MIRQFNDAKRKPIALVSINSGSGCQFAGRDKLATAERYAEDMKSGDWDWDRHDARPTVFWDGEWYWLADGFHRVRAAQIAGLVEIQCDVREGTIEDARAFAIFVCPNKHHGDAEAAVTKSDRVRQALTMPDVQGMSKSELARVLGVSRQIVQQAMGKTAPHNGAARPCSPEQGGIPASKPPRTPRLVTDADEAAPDDVPEVQVEEDPWVTPPVDDGVDAGGDDEREGAAPPLELADSHIVAFEMADERLQDAARAIKVAIEKVAAIEATRASGYCAVTTITGSLKSCLFGVNDARYIRVCEDCHGVGCVECGNTGYVSRGLQRRYNAEERRA